YQHSLALHSSSAAIRFTNVSGDVRRNSVAVVVVGFRFLRGAGPERLRLVAGQHSGNHIPRSLGPRPVPQSRGPGLVFPGDDIALRVQPRALVDGPRVAVIFPGHLILARKLYPHRLAHRLRKNGGIVGYRVSAVQSIATRAPF